MDRGKATQLLNWLDANKFHAVSNYTPGSGYFISPLTLFGQVSFSQFIQFREVDFKPSEPNVSFVDKLAKFQDAFLSDDSLHIFALLESTVSSVDYDLVHSRIAQFGSRLKYKFNSAYNVQPQASMTVWINPGQSVFEILETLLVPNLNIVNQFELMITHSSPDIFASLVLIAELISKSNLCGIAIKLDTKPHASTSLIPILQSCYPPTLAVVLDDCDVFSSVDRMLDLIRSIPYLHLRVDIWVQQSTKKKFTDRFNVSVVSLANVKGSTDLVNIEAINPTLSSNTEPRKSYINLLTFRKVDELLPMINRYQQIRELSLWTSNVSRAIEMVHGIKNCPTFSINTINDSSTLDQYNNLHFSHINYQLKGQFTFKSHLSESALSKSLSNVDLAGLITKSRKQLPSRIEDRFLSLLTTLPKDHPVSLGPKDILTAAKLNQTTFKEVNKCLLLRKLLPIGVVCVCLDGINQTVDPKMTIGLIGSIILYGNCCVIIEPPNLPEIIETFIEKLKSTFPMSVEIIQLETTPIPYGWIYKDSGPIGLSININCFLGTVDLVNACSIFTSIQSTLFPIADQLSLSTSAPTGY